MAELVLAVRALDVHEANFNWFALTFPKQFSSRLFLITIVGCSSSGTLPALSCKSKNGRPELFDIDSL